MVAVAFLKAAIYITKLVPGMIIHESAAAQVQINKKVSIPDTARA